MRRAIGVMMCAWMAGCFATNSPQVGADDTPSSSNDGRGGPGGHVTADGDTPASPMTQPGISTPVGASSPSSDSGSASQDAAGWMGTDVWGEPMPVAGTGGGAAGTGGAAGSGAPDSGNTGGAGGSDGADWSSSTMPPDNVPNEAGRILNPTECATMYPFVLAIAPSGNSGSVSGWLESTPVLAFQSQLPRFLTSWGPEDGDMRDMDIGVWWSIATLGDEMGNGAEMYFYPGEGDLSSMQIAVAEGAMGFDDIDYSTLEFSSHATRSVSVGTVVVVHNLANDVWVALRVDRIYAAAGDQNELCAGIDASWSFAL